MSRSLVLCGLVVALSFVLGSDAGAGFGHHRRQVDPSCAAPAEVGCSAFEPTCALEPSCVAEPDCGAESCCPSNPCIKYRHKHAHKHKCGNACCDQPTYETVLNATSPETCAMVAVPVCLPSCCQGCPCETSRSTLLGCGQVRYDYACGCSVIVRFQKHGDIQVTYVGF